MNVCRPRAAWYQQGELLPLLEGVN